MDRKVQCWLHNGHEREGDILCDTCTKQLEALGVAHLIAICTCSDCASKRQLIGHNRQQVSTFNNLLGDIAIDL